MIETIDQAINPNFGIAMILAVVAGLVHGFAGFGVGLVLVPSLAIMFGPVEAVAITGITSIAATAPLLPGAIRVMDSKQVLPILAPIIIAVPVGSYLLLTVDPVFMRKAIGALVFGFGVLLAYGYRWRGSRSVGTAVVVGALGGVVGGSSSVAGPIFTAYLLSSQAAAGIVRGAILVVTTAVSVATIAALGIGHAFGPETVVRSLALIPPNAVGIGAGAHLFGRSNDAVYRRVALGLLLLVGAAAMIV